MVGSLSAGLLLADEAGAHLPSVDDFLPPEILFQGTPFAINRIILIRIVATIVLLVVLGVTAKRAKLIPGRWQGVVEYGLDFVRDKVVYDVMGEARGKRYVPMITTLFFTIFIFNLCGIIPGMNMAANATVVMPLVFAVWTLIQYWIAAIRSQGLVGLLLLIPACLYSVDVGEVAVIRNMGGSLAGHSEDAGFHWKTPWQSVIKYDTRNNLINFYKDTDYKYDGGSAVGKQVTVNDRSGASADIDIQVNYSLDPSAAEYLYSEYGKQQTFTQNYISNDLRSVAREQSGRFDTLTMLTNRGEYTKAVQDVLAAKWRKIGLTVEQVSVQDVRYGEAITKKYTEAQAAEIDKQKALNEQQVAKTEAETKKIKAQGEADANAVLNESLTDNVLKQHYIDALSNADQLVVVPDGADTLVQTK